jgi:RNA polymerase sigma-70 factor, ECF subfamily
MASMVVDMGASASTSDPRSPGSSKSLDQLVALFDQHVNGVYTVGYRIVWNAADADDITQATFLQALVHMDKLRDPSSARAWLYRIAYREAIAVLRRRRDTPVDPADIPEQQNLVTPETEVVALELAELLGGAIERLPLSLRAAFVLRDVEGLSMADVAFALDIGESAAKMRVHRARAQLREELKEALSDL